MRRYLIICVLLILSLMLNACYFTSSWDQKIDNQVAFPHYNSWSPESTFFPEPVAKDVNGFYYKGEYKGIKQLNNQKYHFYIYFNPSDKPSKRFMEILVPISNTNTVAILRTFDQYSRAEYRWPTKLDLRRAYLRYTSTNMDRVPAVNPKFLAAAEAQWYKSHHFPNKFSDSVFSSEGPSLLDVTAVPSGSGAIIRFGQRMKGDATSVGKGQNLEAVYVCPTTTDASDALAGSQTYTIGCDTWLWSRPIKANIEELHSQGDDLEKKRRHGYFLTVPLDIITFPVQAVVAVIWVPVGLMFQH